MKRKVVRLSTLFALFSFVGTFSAQEKKKDSIKENSIGEVVIVAFGKQKKEEITGSIQELKPKDISALQNGNVLQGLAGRVAGVQIVGNGQPGSSPSIRMRGIGSINASSEPLIVLDGIPYPGSLNSIPSSDIESLSFLEDASSNALYGSRGANGVIIITTKKGTRKGIHVDFDIKTGINFRATPEYDIISSPAEYYLAYFNRVRVGEKARGKTDAQAYTEAINKMNATLGYNAYNVPFNQLINQDGSFNQNAKLLYQDNWQKLLFRPNLRQEANLSFTANTDKLKAYTSLGYLNDRSYLIGSGFKRLSLRSNLEYALNEKLKFGANLNYSNSEQNLGDGGSFANSFQFSRNIAPFYPVYLRDNDYNRVYDIKGRAVYDYGDGKGPNGARRSYAVFENPVGNRQYDLNKVTNNTVNTNLFVQYKFLKDFDFTYNFGGVIINSQELVYGNPLGGTTATVGGRLAKSNTLKYAFNHQQLLSYNKQLGAHNISVLLGHELNQEKSDYFGARKEKLFLEGLAVFDNVLKMNEIPGNQYDYAVEGFFSRVLYNYKNKYFFNASLRRDGSSVFSKENRWGTFYGLGAAWDISKEDFLKDSEVVNALKVKASYGQQGNDIFYFPGTTDRIYYAYKNLYKVSNFGDDTPVVTTEYLGNNKLRWENSQNLNAGFETALFNRRLSINAEYFERKVSDMIYRAALPFSNVGYYPRLENIGNMRNRGVQVSINGDVIKTENFTWNLYANLTHYKNKITKLPDAQRENGITDGLFLLKEGSDRYAYYLKEFAGVDPLNGDALWYKDGVDASGNAVKQVTNSYAEATLYQTGKSAIPKVYGGFGTQIRFKNITLSANFAYQLGGWGYDQNYRSLLHSDNYASNYHRDVHNTWAPENPTASLPRIDISNSNQNANSTLFLTKSDYLSLQDLTLSVGIPQSFLENYGIRDANIYVTGNNLFLLSKRRGYDPRLSISGVSETYGYNLLSSVSLGLNLKF